MKIGIDRELDIVTIRLTDAAIEESDELTPGFIVDLDSDGHMVGMEILDASKLLGDLNKLAARKSKRTRTAKPGSATFSAPHRELVSS